MGKIKDLSPRKIGQIEVLLNNSELKQKDIAKKLSVSSQTVSNIKRKLDKGLSLDSARAGKCGRKRKTTPRMDRRIKQMAIKDRRTSCTKIRTEMLADGIDVSRITVNRRLLEGNLRAYRPRKKPRLTEKMIKARQDWADAHVHWTCEDWDQVRVVYLMYFPY
jgi:DNA-directed RNA polymerase I, II, and III subunit RPABC1